MQYYIPDIVAVITLKSLPYHYKLLGPTVFFSAKP